MRRTTRLSQAAWLPARPVVLPFTHWLATLYFLCSIDRAVRDGLDHSIEKSGFRPSDHTLPLASAARFAPSIRLAAPWQSHLPGPVRADEWKPRFKAARRGIAGPRDDGGPGRHLRRSLPDGVHAPGVDPEASFVITTRIPSKDDESLDRLPRHRRTVPGLRGGAERRRRRAAQVDQGRAEGGERRCAGGGLPEAARPRPGLHPGQRVAPHAGPDPAEGAAARPHGPDRGARQLHDASARRAARALPGRGPCGAEIYEADYGTLRQEILDPDSGLYRSRPDFLVVATTWRDLGHRPELSDDRGVVARKVEAEAAEWTSLWGIGARPARMPDHPEQLRRPAVAGPGEPRGHAPGRLRTLRLARQPWRCRMPPRLTSRSTTSTTSPRPGAAGSGATSGSITRPSSPARPSIWSTMRTASPR